MLPNIIIYLVAGFAFLKVFAFTSIKRESLTFENFALQSLAVGFILYSVAEYLSPQITTKPHGVILFLLGCASLGFLFGKIITTDKVSGLLSKIGLQGTTHDSFWQDIDDVGHDVWVHLIYRNIGREYFGVLCMHEAFERNPMILLNRYEIIDTQTKETIKDYNEDPTRRILLDTLKADEIRLVYDLESPKAKKTQTAINKMQEEKKSEVN